MTFSYLKVSQFIVGGFLASLLIFVAFQKTGPYWGTALTAVLVYDILAKIDKNPGDTISEVIVRLSDNHLVPWIFGGLTVYMIETKFLVDPYLIVAWALLQGHFFFSMGHQAKELVAKAVASVAEESGASPLVVANIKEEIKK